MLPVALIFPPTQTSHATARPPFTCNAPVVVLVEVVVSQKTPVQASTSSINPSSHRCHTDPKL